MDKCIFCRIANGEFKGSVIWEDDKHIAFLDLNPNVKGMTLVIPKKHFDSDVFEMSDEEYSRLMIATKKVVQILEKALGVLRVAMVMEGQGINHAHIKLYPMHGLTQKFGEIIEPGTVYFEKYPGYIMTKRGPEKTIEELNKLAKEIRESVKND